MSAQPADSRPTAARLADARASEAQPGAARPSETQPGAARPTAARPSEAQPGAARPIVELRHATKTYPGPPEVTVLHPTTLTLMPGEQVAVVGPSGSGKSTLLAILGTLDDPTEGTVLIDGREVTQLWERERSALRAERIGFVFQQFHLLPALTATENVATALLYSGVRHGQRLRRAVEALAAVGLEQRMHHRPGELSGGEQQRVAIARALVREPGILFADEPTGALDTSTGAGVVELLTGIAARGTTVVVVTHDEQVASHFARRIRLRDGVATEARRTQENSRTQESRRTQETSLTQETRCTPEASRTQENGRTQEADR